MGHGEAADPFVLLWSVHLTATRNVTAAVDNCHQERLAQPAKAPLRRRRFATRSRAPMVSNSKWLRGMEDPLELHLFYSILISLCRTHICEWVIQKMELLLNVALHVREQWSVCYEVMMGYLMAVGWILWSLCFCWFF
jgi:hypothetical protein